MSKPFNGYPSRTAFVAAMRANGWSTRSIADALGVDTKQVQSLETSLRRTQRYQFQRLATQDIRLPNHVLPKLIEQSGLRGVTPTALAAQILCAVLGEDLVGAVLDDEREAA